VSAVQDKHHAQACHISRLEMPYPWPPRHLGYHGYSLELQTCSGLDRS